MTVNELLDKLRSVSIRLLGKETEHAGRAIILYRESAIMLRQQQDEIETLKSEIKMQNERWKKSHQKENN
jgi:Mg2+ and Co2+ transporter CorA